MAQVLLTGPKADIEKQAPHSWIAQLFVVAPFGALQYGEQGSGGFTYELDEYSRASDSCYHHAHGYHHPSESESPHDRSLSL